jgi:hypothetical protein
VDDLEAAGDIRPYAWLLDRVGEGLRLTAAGWLPPIVVTAAMHDLDLEKEWIGKGNREDLTVPVARLRESAQRLGLLRVSKGMLLPTKVGGSLAAQPTALWRHVTERRTDRLVMLSPVRRQRWSC